MLQAHRTTVLIALAIGLIAYLPRKSNGKSLNQEAPPPSTRQTTDRPRRRKVITYKNKKYRFSFTLPDTWKGYSIVVGEWDGAVFDEDGSGPVRFEKGPQLTIRHPRWTNDVPWQDIPIMVFTHAQWKFVEQQRIEVSAAPIGPSEIGRNAEYVFGLPPRFNVTDVNGREEVLEIVRNLPLHPL
jgi:hypothetical protein